MTDLRTMPTLGMTESGGEIKMRRPMPDRNGRVPCEIVLAYLPHNSVTPFVTWQCNTDKFRSSYWGHYFRADEADAAIADFEKRGK